MTRLADLITQFEPELLSRYGQQLLPSHRQALAALKACRSRFAPQLLAACDSCHTQRCLPHSCGHRACPRYLRQSPSTIKPRLGCNASFRPWCQPLTSWSPSRCPRSCAPWPGSTSARSTHA